MKRGGPLKRKRRLNRVSERKVAYEDELTAILPALYARAHYMCEARLDGCTLKPITAHHKLRRSQGGKNTLSNLLVVCWRCHKRIHSEPSWSYENGYLLRRDG